MALIKIPIEYFTDLEQISQKIYMEPKVTPNSLNNHFSKILFIYFLERGEGKEKEKERNISVWLPLYCPL